MCGERTAVIFISAVSFARKLSMILIPTCPSSSIPCHYSAHFSDGVGLPTWNPRREGKVIDWAKIFQWIDGPPGERGPILGLSHLLFIVLHQVLWS